MSNRHCSWGGVGLGAERPYALMLMSPQVVVIVIPLTVGDCYLCAKDVQVREDTVSAGDRQTCSMMFSMLLYRCFVLFYRC